MTFAFCRQPRRILLGHTPFGLSILRVTGLGVRGHDAAASRRGHPPRVWPYTWTSPLGRLCRARRLKGSWISVEKIQQETFSLGHFLFIFIWRPNVQDSVASNVMKHYATIRARKKRKKNSACIHLKPLVSMAKIFRWPLTVMVSIFPLTCSFLARALSRHSFVYSWGFRPWSMYL